MEISNQSLYKIISKLRKFTMSNFNDFNKTLSMFKTLDNVLLNFFLDISNSKCQPKVNHTQKL